jgi:hypothetical protein
MLEVLGTQPDKLHRPLNRLRDLYRLCDNVRNPSAAVATTKERVHLNGPGPHASRFRSCSLRHGLARALDVERPDLRSAPMPKHKASDGGDHECVAEITLRVR